MPIGFGAEAMGQIYVQIAGDEKALKAAVDEGVLDLQRMKNAGVISAKEAARANRLISKSQSDLAKSIRSSTATLRSMRWAWRDIMFVVGSVSGVIYGVKKAADSYAKAVEKSPELFSQTDVARVERYRTAMENVSQRALTWKSWTVDLSTSWAEGASASMA